MAPGYEILPDMKSEDGSTTLSASYTANNGLRIQVLDLQDGPADWTVFDFADTEQVRQLGEALLRWAADDDAETARIQRT